MGTWEGQGSLEGGVVIAPVWPSVYSDRRAKDGDSAQDLGDKHSGHSYGRDLMGKWREGRALLALTKLLPVCPRAMALNMRYSSPSLEMLLCCFGSWYFTILKGYERAQVCPTSCLW